MKLSFASSAAETFCCAEIWEKNNLTWLLHGITSASLKQELYGQTFDLFFFSMNGVLEFYDTSDVVCMNQAEHFMATDVEWDPTGRYVATSVSWWAHKVSETLDLYQNQVASTKNEH